jgi:hypothetical protein
LEFNLDPGMSWPLEFCGAAGSPTAAQKLHRFLREGEWRIAVAWSTDRLLAVQALVPWASDTIGKVSIGVLELGLS